MPRKKARRPSIPVQLEQAERVDLIRVVQLEPELQYLFRHELVKEATYQSILRRDRKELHRSVGEAILKLYPKRLTELSGTLAYHFELAQDTQRPLRPP